MFQVKLALGLEDTAWILPRPLLLQITRLELAVSTFISIRTSFTATLIESVQSAVPVVATTV